MTGRTILAAGGIVVRRGARPLLAVVQHSKDGHWVLPRGKLKRNERPVIGARREVVEETGHRVRVHEFLGAITYQVHGRPKVVRFWRMQAAAQPSRDTMKDIAAIQWLPLAAAVRRLSYPLEKLFLKTVGRHAIRRRKRGLPGKKRRPAANAKPRRSTGRSRAHKAKTAAARRATRGRPAMRQRVPARVAR